MRSKFIRRIQNSPQLLKRYIWYIVNKRRFKSVYKNSYIRKPFIITPSCISLGRKTLIIDNARIEGVFSYNKKKFSPQIVFGDNVTIQQNVHITCANRIVIGENTAIAANVTITDIHHPYTDINIPIEQQNIEVKEVIIGDECKIYNGTVILPDVHIGKHVSIGANSVVTHDIPDFCVAVGAPAHVIKRYNPKSQRWEKTDKQGNFLE